MGIPFGQQEGGKNANSWPEGSIRPRTKERFLGSARGKRKANSCFWTKGTGWDRGSKITGGAGRGGER